MIPRLGSVLGCDYYQFRLDAFEAQTDQAVIYLVTPLQGVHYVHHPDVVVGDTVFVVVLQQLLESEVAQTPDRWQVAKKRMRQAMTLVNPSVAGFPEWNKIRQDDSVKLYQGELGDLHWGAFQVSTYHRRLQKAQAAYRRPHIFSESTRQSLLKAANNRCQRCGSQDRLEADHTLPIAFDGTNDKANGMILCSTCHLEKSRAERKAFGLSIESVHSKGTVPIRRKGEAFADYLDRYMEALAVLSGWKLETPDN